MDAFIHTPTGRQHTQASVTSPNNRSNRSAWVTADRSRSKPRDFMLAWGLDVTHVDAHMGTAAHPRYLPDLLELALTQGLPPLFPRQTAADWQAAGLTGEDARQAEQTTFQLEERGVPLVDHLRMLPLDVGGDHAALTRQMLRDLPPGITHFILHPAHDTPELRAICGDWPARVANYHALMDPALRRDVQNLGIQVIGYRPLRDLLRQRMAAGEVKP